MKHLFLVVLIVLAAFLAPQPAQARNLKIYTFNGPSRRAAMTPPPPVPVVDSREMKLGNIAWASVNVDDFGKFAAKPDMLTKFYQFNRTKAWAATGAVSGMVDIDENSDWLSDSAPCPAGWRLPTNAEYIALDSEGSTWAEANDGRGNSIAGRFYGSNHATCSLPNNMSSCVFLPVSGYRVSNGLLYLQDGADKHGYGWSSISSSDTSAYYLSFANGDNSNPVGNKEKSHGFPVRCVRDVP